MGGEGERGSFKGICKALSLLDAMSELGEGGEPTRRDEVVEDTERPRDGDAGVEQGGQGAESQGEVVGADLPVPQRGLRLGR